MYEVVLIFKPAELRGNILVGRTSDPAAVEAVKASLTQELEEEEEQWKELGEFGIAKMVEGELARLKTIFAKGGEGGV